MNNEGRVCDLIIKQFECRHGKQREKLVFPDSDERGTQAVDVKFQLAGKSYAIEHTKIEPFEGSIRHEKLFEILIGDLEKKLEGTFPTRYMYQIIFPLNTKLLRNMKPNVVKESIEKWLLNAVGKISQKEYNCFELDSRTIEGMPEGLPFNISLIRQPSIGYQGNPIFCRSVGQFDRVSRLKKALGDKCPKIAKCKNQNDHTVLVLENADISLSNHIDIFDALKEASENRTDLPDDIYLVETSIYNMWVTWKLWDNGKFNESLVPQIIDPTDLIDINKVHKKWIGMD